MPPKKSIITNVPDRRGNYTPREIADNPALRSPASRPISNRTSPQDQPVTALRDVTQIARNQLVGVLTGSPAAQDQEASQEPPSKRSIQPNSQDTSQLTETDDKNDRQYDKELVDEREIIDDNEDKQAIEKSLFADYPPLLRTFLEMGSENAIPRLLNDINRLDLTKQQKGVLLRRLQTQIKHINEHKEANPELYDTAFENTTVGEVASSLQNYVNYFVNKTKKVIQNAPEWTDRAGSFVADVPRYEMDGAAWTHRHSQVIRDQIPLPAESELNEHWNNIVLPENYSRENVLEAFRGQREGKLNWKELYEDVVDDALIQYLPGAVTFLLNRIDRKNKNKRDKPTEGIINPSFSLEDDIIQLKHRINQFLNDIRAPLPLPRNTTDNSPDLKKIANIDEVFRIYPLINKLIGAYTEVDPGEHQFLHPDVAWKEIANLPSTNKAEQNRRAEALKVSQVLIEGTDLMSVFDDLVKEKVDKPVMTHENFLKVDDTGLYIREVDSRELDAINDVVSMLTKFNSGKVGPANDGYIKYKDFTDQFKKYFNVLKGTSESSSEEEVAEETEVSSLPEDPRQNKADLTMSESKLSPTSLDNSSTSSSSRLPNASQISDNTLQKYSKEFAGHGYSLTRLPPRAPENNQGDDQAEESEISEIHFNHVDPEVLAGLNDELKVANATVTQLKQMFRNLAEASGVNVTDEDPQSLLNQVSALYNAKNNEFAALRTELNSLRQKDNQREQLVKRYKTLQQATNELKQQLTDHQDRRDKLENLLREKDAALAAQISENETLARTLKDAEEFAEGRTLDYENNLDKMSETIQNLRGLLEQKTQELNALREQNQETNNTTVQELENDIQNYVNQLQAANERIVELEEAQNIAKDVSHSSNSLRNIQKELKEIKTGAHAIQAGVYTHVNQFNSQLDYLSDRFRMLASMNSILQTNLNAANSLTDARLRDVGRLKERLREAELARDVAQQHLRQQASQEPIFRSSSTSRNVDPIDMVTRSTSTPVDLFRRVATLPETVSVGTDSDSVIMVDTSAGTLPDMNQETGPEDFTFDGHTVSVPSDWPRDAKKVVAAISKQLDINKQTLRQFIEKVPGLVTEIHTLNEDVRMANVRADANEEFAKEMEEKNKLLRSASAPAGVISAAPVVPSDQTYKDFAVEHLNQEITGLNREIDFLRNQLTEVQTNAAQVIDELQLQNEGLVDINIQKDDEIREKNTKIEELLQRLNDFNRKSVEKQTDLANAVMFESVEKLKDRSKSARRANSYRLKREADYDYAASMYELEKDRRAQDHERQKEIITLKNQLQQQKEAYDRLHEANKILHASNMELTKMDMAHAHQVGKMDLGAVIYKDRQEHGVSLGLAKQGIEGDRAMRAKVVKNNEAGKLIAKLAGSSDDAIRALGASMFANLLQDMTTMTDEELQATNAPELIKMYDDGVINNIITALATPRRAVDDSLAKRITELEGTVRSFINMTAQRTAHVGAAQAYHPPRRVVMGRGPAGVGRSNVRAPRKGRAKSRPVRKPKRGGRRSKK